MAMINIVTGHTGVDHVTSDDDRHFNAAIVGNGDFILGGGNGWEPSIIGANSVRVASGEASVQGCHIRSAEPIEIILEVGASGYKRNDLIGIRYRNVGGIESAELTAVKGTPTTGTPVDPSYTAEDILNGGEERFAPLIRAVFNGTAIEATEVVATIVRFNLSSPSIVESGTDGEWTYRKWSDGAAECWCVHNYGTLSTFQAGSLYIATTVSIPFPSGLFVDVPLLNFNISPTVDGYCMIVGSNGAQGEVSTKDRFGSITVGRPNSSAYIYNVRLAIRAIGRWK